MVLGAILILAGCASGDTESASVSPPSAVEDVEPNEYLEDVLALVRDRAYYADRLDFDALRQQAALVAADASDASDTHPFVRSVVTSLNDGHSGFFTPDQVRSMSANDDRSGAVPTASYDDGVLYLSLPGTGADPRSPAGVAYIDAAHEAFREQEACAVVVDVASNGGGNVFTMLSALAPVLGPGPTVSYRERDGETITYRIEPDGSVAADNDVLAPPPDSFNPVDVPMAVLQGPSTASSGEAVVMATRGRPDTRTFGIPTAGLPTGNEFIELPDGAALNLTTAVGVDFGGTPHETAIAPQHHVEGATATREAAMSWVKEGPGCARSE